MLPRARPLLWESGGPVVMVQIENEYGAFAGSGSAPPTAGATAYKTRLLSLAREGLGLAGAVKDRARCGFELLRCGANVGLCSAVK